MHPFDAFQRAPSESRQSHKTIRGICVIHTLLGKTEQDDNIDEEQTEVGSGRETCEKLLAQREREEERRRRVKLGKVGREREERKYGCGCCNRCRGTKSRQASGGEGYGGGRVTIHGWCNGDTHLSRC